MPARSTCLAKAYCARGTGRLRPQPINPQLWQNYAEQMLEVLSAEPALENTADAGYAPRPDYRPVTKFERRGLKLGHGVWDLVFKRR